MGHYSYFLGVLQDIWGDPQPPQNWSCIFNTVGEHAGCLLSQEVLPCPGSYELELGITALSADWAWGAQFT